MMSTTAQAVRQAKIQKDAFVERTATDLRTTVTHVERILRGCAATYSVSKEKELFEYVKEQLDMQIKAKAEELKRKYAVKVEPCWLSEVYGIQCQGHIIRKRGEFPTCSIGGVRHFMARIYIPDGTVAKFLNEVEAISQKKQNEQKELLKIWREALRDTGVAPEIVPPEVLAGIKKELIEAK